MLRTSRNDHDVALAADPLFAAEAEVDLALQNPRDQLIYVTALNSRLACGSSREREEAVVLGASSRNGLSSNSLLPSFGQGAGVRYGCGMREAIRGKLWPNS